LVSDRASKDAHRGDRLADGRHPMKSLLVHIDGSPRCTARLGLAIALSQGHDAHLTALFAGTPPLLGMPYSFAGGPDMVQILQDLHLERRAKARAAFQALAAGTQAEWAELGAMPLFPGFAGQALFADLMVFGQHDPDDAEGDTPADFVSSMMLTTGRPALVVPHSGTFETAGTRALVAWKPSAESARALSASLPLLRLATEVTVIEWGHEPDPAEQQALHIERYLELHGVKARFERHPDEPSDIGELLLSEAADLGADLLVMGCYAHHRAREMVLGGVTRTILASMTLPVLMSH
jgi:nucleotide-binding universal stress UspA family protein